MLKSYIKIALKVLLRQKFFTVVSLSGIVFTITVLIVAAAFFDHMMSPAKPGSKFDRTMFVEHIEVKTEGRHMYSSPSYAFLNRYVSTMETPETVSIHRRASTASIYKDDVRLDFQLRFTDSEFWNILEFEFLEGRPYDRSAVENADYVAVITEKTRRQVFGDEVAVGKSIETSEGNFRVIGVVPKQDIPTLLASADIYAPISIHKSSMNSQAIYGSHLAFVLARDKDDFDAIRAEFARKLEQVHKDYEGEWEMIKTRIGTQAEALVTYVLGDDAESGLIIAIGIIAGIMILFMLVPAINLINLNITRIMERASEIGVRKAFGASKLELVGQFLTENIILTLIGGAIAWGLSWTLLWQLTSSDLIPYGEFRPSIVLFLECLLICLFFGVLSGAYPAWRMSRMQPVEALRGVES